MPFQSPFGGLRTTYNVHLWLIDTNHFCSNANECLTTLLLTVFKETLQQTFFKRSAILDGYWQFCVFEPPLGGLGATYDIIGKRVVAIKHVHCDKTKKT